MNADDMGPRATDPDIANDAVAIDRVISEVAAAVGLAEGEPGIRDILSAVLAAEPVAVRDVSRMAELPVPIVAAVCSELRKRDVIDTQRPVRLTAAGRSAVLAAVGGPPLTAACPECAGRGLAIPVELAGLAETLQVSADGAPTAKADLDQTHCTVATKLSRVLLLDQAHALAGQRILLLGDDDLISVAIAEFARYRQQTAAIRRLTVIDADADVLDWIGTQAEHIGMPVELVRHDLRQPLPAGLTGAFDVVLTDPPYTVAGAELFLSRAVSGLSGEPGRHVFFSFGARRPDETLAVQRAIGEMGLAVRSLRPGFNEYLGAGILAGTSNLYHLRSTASARPLVAGEYAGPIYTADSRAAATRPYRCAECKAVHEVGPGARWPQIAALQAAGCPTCGGTTFRPMPLARQPAGQPSAGQPPAGQPPARRR
ncbi:MAG TPA: bis-aminopropyl spermidine synthase family protein [Streptosporangiaceae bacterium]